MSINISETLLNSLTDYLQERAYQDDTRAKYLLSQLNNHKNTSVSNAKSDTQTSSLASLDLDEFPHNLFEAWKTLAIAQVGENYWSYPIRIKDIADTMNIPIGMFVQHLSNVEAENLQLIQSRGANYAIGKKEAASLTFHPGADTVIAVPATQPAKAVPNSTERSQDFRVGDRVRVNENRPQYVNQIGTIDQVISVSCRVKLDNGWSAFLPKNCLEKISS